MSFINSNVQSCPIFLVMRVYISSKLSILLSVKGILNWISVTCFSCIYQILVHFLLSLDLSWSISVILCYRHRKSLQRILWFSLLPSTNKILIILRESLSNVPILITTFQGTSNFHLFILILQVLVYVDHFSLTHNWWSIGTSIHNIHFIERSWNVLNGTRR